MTRRHPDAKPPYWQQDQRGPSGRGLCRWCWQEVPKGHRTFCGAACVEEYREENDWQFVVCRVEARDGGICAVCGCDTWKIARIIQAARRASGRLLRYGEFSGGEMRQLRYVLFGTIRGGYGFAEIDHIQPRSHGGSNHPSNLRTLCIGCHQESTARLAANRAAARKARRALDTITMME